MKIQRYTMDRCKWSLRSRDGSSTQCGRAHVNGTLCTQHEKIYQAMGFNCCGGSDEFPPEHTQDCPAKEPKP